MAASKDMAPLATGFGSLFIQNQFRTAIPCPPAGTNLNGMTAIITGASSGLGLESAKHLVRLGLSHLIVAVRSVEKGKAAVAQIRKETESKAKIDVWPIDMESYDSIKKFVDRCQTDTPRIDIVILNAGLFPGTQLERAPNGHEKSVQVNYLGQMLLAILLLPVIKSKKVPGVIPRITISNAVLASLAKLPNWQGKSLLQALDSKDEPYAGPNRYNVTKLLCQLFFVKLADVVDPNDVIINMVEPGYTKGTSLMRDFSGLHAAFSMVLKALAARPVATASLTYVDAVVVKGKESHGCFLMNCKIFP